MDASAFLISPFKENSSFETPQYTDSIGIRRYYTNIGREEETIRKYEAVDDMLDFYSEIIGAAKNDPALRFRCRNTHKEIPVALSAVYDCCSKVADFEEPPMKLIVQIAENDFDILQRLLENPRRILRRNQQLVQIGRLQQIDNYCIRWLARQPGYTAEEKAGSRQKLMGVVRYETMDTLENRVLKQYMKLCFNECRRYMLKYSVFSNSKRYGIIKRFLSLVRAGLAMPEFESVGNLHGTPRPNYTLQNNRFYRIIWENYMLLANHITQIEMVWRYRHRLLYEMVKLISMAVIDHRIEKDGIIGHEVWLSQYPTDEGVFCKDEDYLYLDFCTKSRSSFRIGDGADGIEFRCRKPVDSSMKMLNIRNSISCYLIPDYVSPKELDFIVQGLSVVYSEEPLFESSHHSINFIGNDEGNFVFDIFRAVSQWFERMAL